MLPHSEVGEKLTTQQQNSAFFPPPQTTRTALLCMYHQVKFSKLILTFEATENENQQANIMTTSNCSVIYLSIILGNTSPQLSATLVQHDASICVVPHLPPPPTKKHHIKYYSIVSSDKKSVLCCMNSSPCTSEEYIISTWALREAQNTGSMLIVLLKKQILTRLVIRLNLLVPQFKLQPFII